MWSLNWQRYVALHIVCDWATVPSKFPFLRQEQSGINDNSFEKWSTKVEINIARFVRMINCGCECEWHLVVDNHKAIFIDDCCSFICFFCLFIAFAPIVLRGKRNEQQTTCLPHDKRTNDIFRVQLTSQSETDIYWNFKFVERLRGASMFSRMRLAKHGRIDENPTNCLFICWIRTNPMAPSLSMTPSAATFEVKYINLWIEK